MPKIIEGIEQNIYNAAYELFSKKGYESVNMKMVASEPLPLNQRFKRSFYYFIYTIVAIYY